MGKIITIVFCISLLFSCKKEKVPEPCEGVSMSGDRAFFVGRWKWYKTDIEEWFDIGPSIYSNYTPQNQGFDYFFTISTDGLYKGYKNNTLIHSIVLSNVDYEFFDGASQRIISLNLDCSSEMINLSNTINLNTDTIHGFSYPFDFYDDVNQIKSSANYFMRE